MKRTLFAASFALLAMTPALRAAEPAETDLAALRYFLSIGDEASVNAELERLEIEFPGTDVRSMLPQIEAKEVDTSPIWQRIEVDDHAGARQLIAELSADHPSWTPPEDMIAVLDGREGQAAFEAAYVAGDLAGAVQALAAFPTILTCDRINNPWRLAELQKQAGRHGDALATFEGVLRTCSQRDYVVATLQKADEIGDREALVSLFALAREKNPTMAEALDVLAVQVGGAAQGDASAARPTVAAKAAAADPAPYAPARATVAPAVRPATTAVSTAASRRPVAGSGDLARAAVAAERQDWAACLDATTHARSAAAVNQRAWCALNFGRANEAIAHFRAVAAGRADPALAREATYGMILGHAQVGQLEQAAHLAARAELTREQRQVVSRAVLSKLALRSFESGHHRNAVEYLDRLSRETGSLDRGLAMFRGWALLKSGKKAAAREQFQRVHAVSPGKDSHEGIVESR